MISKSSLLLIYIVAAYLVQGMAEHFCLPAQPLDNYFLKVHRWDAAQVSSYLGLLMFPWTIKPIYGIVTDVLLPSTKRAYLTFSFVVAACGYMSSYLWPSHMLFGLLLAGCGLSWGTALLCGLVVNVFDGEIIRKIFSAQAIAYYLACMGASVLGGLLCHHLNPLSALQTSFAIAAIVCALGAIVSATLLRDEIRPKDRRVTMQDLKRAIFNKNFLMVAVFIWCWNFSPGFGTPLYFHYTNVLHFSQSEIGQFNATNAAGMLIGASLYPSFARVMRSQQIYVAILLSILSTLSFCLLSSAYSAMALEFLRGTAGMLGILTIYCLVAKVSRPNLETMITAALIAVYNIATQTAGVFGGFLYTHIFHNTLWQLLFASSSMTAACLILVRSLPEDKAVMQPQAVAELIEKTSPNMVPSSADCQ